MLSLPRNSTHYVLSGTKFLRLASRKINCLGNKGTNLQNIEKSIRKIYCPDAGYRFNQRDQAGAEAKIVAYLCRAGNFRSLFDNGIKPHVFVGLHIFKDRWQERINEERSGDIKCDITDLCRTDIPFLKLNPFWKHVDKLIKSSDNWPPSERYYYMAKQVCHSSNYGIKAQMFCLNTLEKSKGKVVISKREGETFLGMYHDLFPEIREWHAQVEQQVRETRVLFNLFGNPLSFTGPLKTESDIKEAFSAVPQSTVACITRRAFSNLQNYIEETKSDWDAMQDNHDSILAQCPDSEEEVDRQQSIMREFLEPTLTNGRGESFKMGSEGVTGYNWSPWDEKKNPRGLKEYKF